MPLQSFVVSAKTISKQMAAAPVSASPAEPKPKGRFIDASEFQQKTGLAPSRPAVSLSTSVTVIRDELAANKQVGNPGVSGASWENCKCLKKLSERNFCTKFLSLCAKESCPPKYREF